MTARFSDKVAVVTGAGSGIGAATARAFAAEGATVIVDDIRGDAAERTVAEILAAGGRASLSSCDVADQVAVDAAVAQAVERFGGIHILVNNAAMSARAPAEKYTQFERVMAVNLGGAFNWSKAVAVHSMIPNGAGVIINVSSLAGFAAVPGDVGYSTTKHGLIGLTKALALDWAPHGIRVNAVAPGVTNSLMVAEMQTRHPEMMAARVGRVPLGRIAEPVDQARAILFLASADADYISGITLPVDGGQLALNPGYAATD